MIKRDQLAILGIDSPLWFSCPRKKNVLTFSYLLPIDFSLALIYLLHNNLMSWDFQKNENKQQ